MHLYLLASERHGCAPKRPQGSGTRHWKLLYYNASRPAIVCCYFYACNKSVHWITFNEDVAYTPILGGSRRYIVYWSAVTSVAVANSHAFFSTSIIIDHAYQRHCGRKELRFLGQHVRYTVEPSANRLRMTATRMKCNFLTIFGR